MELAYQTGYESTIDTLALRDNVKKILQNAALKNNAASKVYHSSNTIQTLNKTSITIDINRELNETLNFLKSDAAMKLLTLTSSQHSHVDAPVEIIIEFNIDESKKNIFAA